jgi:hypothetical protein
MKNQVTITAVLAVIFSGCSVTHNVERAEAPTWGSEVSDQLSGKNVNVVVAGGGVYRGEFLKVDAGNIVQRNESLGVDRAIPLDSVLEIRSGSNAGWTVLGFLGGAIAGGVAGSAVGATSGPEKGDVTGLTTVANMAGGAAVGALVGSVAGGVIVGLATQTHNYSVGHTYRPPRLPGSFNQRQDSTATKIR